MRYFSDECFEELKKIALTYLAYNYDYCYLDAMHEKNRLLGAKTVIAGTSHAMNGIMEKHFKGDVINFSVSSQDIYYDLLHIRKACEEGRQVIENCIINVGYYMFYQDLSLSKNTNYIVKKVYEPLFQDSHHMQIDCMYNPLQEVIELGKEFFSKELIALFCKEWGRSVFMDQGSYYGEMKDRKGNSRLALQGFEWGKMSEAERENCARLRTADHNRVYAHKESRLENGRLIEEIVEYLSKRNIRTVFVVFPFTKWYNQYINPQYKEDIYQLLDNLKFPIEYLDMNELDCFSDNDFLDSDHLNDTGAEKATKVLNDFLELLI